MKHRRVISGVYLTLSILVAVSALPATAEPDTPSETQYDGVTIKHNADGSLDVYDVAESSTQSTPTPTANAQPSSTIELSAIAAPPIDSTPDSLFAVKPVVAVRKPKKGTPVRSWSNGISAL